LLLAAAPQIDHQPCFRQDADGDQDKDTGEDIARPEEKGKANEPDGSMYLLPMGREFVFVLVFFLAFFRVLLAHGGCLMDVLLWMGSASTWVRTEDRITRGWGNVN